MVLFLTRVWIFLFATLSNLSRLALGPIHLPIQWVSEALFPGKSGWSVKLTTDPHLVPRLRMSRAVALLSCMPSWHVLGHRYLRLPLGYPVLNSVGMRGIGAGSWNQKQPLTLTSAEVHIVGSSSHMFSLVFY